MQTVELTTNGNCNHICIMP